MFLNDREKFNLTAREWTEIYAVVEEKDEKSIGNNEEKV